MEKHTSIMLIHAKEVVSIDELGERELVILDSAITLQCRNIESLIVWPNPEHTHPDAEVTLEITMTSGAQYRYDCSEVEGEGIEQIVMGEPYIWEFTL